VFVFVDGEPEFALSAGPNRLVVAFAQWAKPTHGKSRFSWTNGGEATVKLWIG
jgi:hypothetical protein